MSELSREQQLTLSLEEMCHAGEMLWTVVANVEDWGKESDKWQEEARRWRDNFFEKWETARQALTKEVESGWVSVEERLPTVFQWVTLLVDGLATPGYFAGSAIGSPGGASEFWTVARGYVKLKHVTCWHELPTPPQQQGDGG